jgi:hypothetical protein
MEIILEIIIWLSVGFLEALTGDTPKQRRSRRKRRKLLREIEKKYEQEHPNE